MTLLEQEELQDLLHELQSAAYPSYTPGCSPAKFIEEYNQLFESLDRIDQNDYRSLAVLLNPRGSQIKEVGQQNLQCLDKFILSIVKLLNDLCSNCHRAELADKLLIYVKTYKGNLVNLAIGKRPLMISDWQKELDMGNIENRVRFCEDPTILTILDRIYLAKRCIPALDCLILRDPEIFMAKQHFEELFHWESPIPLAEQCYLGIIASSTYGCRYMWNQLVSQFIHSGGDQKWIRQGLNAAPPHLQNLSQLSCVSAYDFKHLSSSEVLEKIIAENHNINSSYIQVAIILLSYYQALSCICMVTGLQPESTQYERFLPEFVVVKPSLESFEETRRREGFFAKTEKELAQLFAKTLLWEDQADIEQLNEIEGFRRMPIEMGKLGSAYIDEQDEEESVASGKQVPMQTLNFVAKIYQKYVNIENPDCQTPIKAKPVSNRPKKSIKRGAQIKTEVKINRLTLNTQTEPRSRHNLKSNSFGGSRLKNQITKYDNESMSFVDMSKSIGTMFLNANESFIYASEWEFEVDACKYIQATTSAKIVQASKSLLSSLRGANKERSKRLKNYYELCYRYMYQHVNYVKLIEGQISLAERNYVKLITKSPYLFSEKSFRIMKSDLAQEGIEVNRFVLEAVSYKLQINISLLTALCKSYFQDQNDQPN